MRFGRSVRRRVARTVVLALLATLLIPVGAMTLTAAGTAAQSQGTFYGPYSDGCYYLWNGAAWIEGWCPQRDGSWDVFTPSGRGQWRWALNYRQYGNGGTTIKDEHAVVQMYADGSVFWVYTQPYDGWPAGAYFILNAAGVVVEVGATDFTTRIPVAKRNQAGELVQVRSPSTQASTGRTDMDRLEECYSRGDWQCVQTLEYVYAQQRRAANVWLLPECARSTYGCP